MLFNSYEFILAFLPLTAIIFFLTARFIGKDTALGVLVVASLIYYGWWNWTYLPLLVGSIVANFTVGRFLEPSVDNRRAGYKKTVLIIGIACNLGLLGYFKYANFFLDNLALLTGTTPQTFDIVLPLAISFFTFQQVAYLVDAYRGETKEHSFLHYCLFVTFFPQLIAGPIVHHKEMLPQFERDETYSARAEMVAVGVSIFVIGLFKKVVLADSLAIYASPLFAMADSGIDPSFLDAWGGALAYTFQLYFDFSGYSDMAMGIAFMFGIRLPLNFDSPYKAANIIDFWRRWHITLSRFLRDYLYFSLGGNRRGKVRRYANLLLTMVLGGFWHGAGWTFVAWGGLHGIYLVLNHAWQKALGSRYTYFARIPGYSVLARIITFMAVVVAWVFFRSETFDGAVRVLFAMSGTNSSVVGSPPSMPQAATMLPFWLTVSFIIVWMLPNTFEIASHWRIALDFYKRPRNRALAPVRLALNRVWAIGIATMFVYSLIKVSTASEFLYFNF